mmetsp:Transcript_25675/g.34289  ORF Transcript_25675/g.34289 Transcript_25675/m.34289 type:complete len:80 (+) Transcript_25675:458-697(+)
MRVPTVLRAAIFNRVFGQILQSVAFSQIKHYDLAVIGLLLYLFCFLEYFVKPRELLAAQIFVLVVHFVASDPGDPELFR